MDWIAWLGEWGKPYLVVLTKCDKLTNNEKSQSVKRWTLDELKVHKPILSSAQDGTGVDKIWQWMDDVRAGRAAAA
jgi:GTP-binding protein EngB required for normal cell division